jgi:hypothetical protein
MRISITYDDGLVHEFEVVRVDIETHPSVLITATGMGFISLTERPEEQKDEKGR